MQDSIELWNNKEMVNKIYDEQLSHLVFHRVQSVNMIEEKEFKDNPVVELKKDEDDRFPFSFGVRKAKIILEHIEEIKKFVEEHDKKDA